MENDIVYTRFDTELISSLMIAIINVYQDAEDYPGKVVARLFDGNSPTNAVMVASSYEEMACRKPQSMVALPKTAADHDELIETWI